VIRTVLGCTLIPVLLLAACSREEMQDLSEEAKSQNSQPKERSAAADDSLKRARAIIESARKSGKTEIRLGDWEWEIPRIPDEIATLDKLEALTLNVFLLTDLSPLVHLTNLRSLEIYQVRDADLSPLSHLTELRELGISGDGVKDIEFLAALTKLEKLRIDGNVGDWQVISGLTQLRELHLRSDLQSDLAPVSQLTRLQQFVMTDGSVTSGSPSIFRKVRSHNGIIW